MSDTGTFIRVHKRGGYFRIRGFGFLILVTKHPLYGMRHRLHGERNLGPVWFKILKPRGRVFVSNEVTFTIPRQAAKPQDPTICAPPDGGTP